MARDVGYKVSHLPRPVSLEHDLNVMQQHKRRQCVCVIVGADLTLPGSDNACWYLFSWGTSNPASLLPILSHPVWIDIRMCAR